MSAGIDIAKEAQWVTLEALLEQRAVVRHQQALGDVDPAVGVDPDQVVVESRAVDFRESDAVGDGRLTEQAVGVGHNVGGI